MNMIRNASNVTYLHTSNRYQEWNSLINICYDEGKVAKCDYIASKKGMENTPAPIVLKKFEFNTPNLSGVSKLKIRYSDRIVKYKGTSDKYYPSIGSPTITVSSGKFKYTAKGVAPIKNFTTHEIVIDNPQITREELNSDDFTVTISYPANTSNNVGGLYILKFEVEIEYENEEYFLSITEPRHWVNELPGDEEYNGGITWSTPDDPTILQIYENFTITTYFRSRNINHVSEQEVVFYIPPCLRIDGIRITSGRLEWIDEFHVKWYVTPPTVPWGNKLYPAIWGKSARINFDVHTIALRKEQLFTATHPQTSWNYYFEIENQFGRGFRDDDVTLTHGDYRSLVVDNNDFNVNLEIDSIDLGTLADMDFLLTMQTKLWDADNGTYVYHPLLYEMDSINQNYSIHSQDYDEKTSTVVIDLEYNRKNHVNDIFVDLVGYFKDNGNNWINLPEGKYEFHVFMDYGEGSPKLFKFPFYVASPPIYCFDLQPANLWVNTPNIATVTGSGGCTFLCETQEGFGRWSSNMSGFKSFIEDRYKHIGAMRVEYSHYKPKFTFKNPVKEGSWKERIYMGKTGKWEQDLSLNIYLPHLQWKTLEGFVKMDKPVSIELCPRCSDDDVLNHRGWVELEDISNVERVNPWVYKGEIGVRYLTKKYWAKANIIKGNRICDAEVPYNLMKVLDKGDYFLNYFELLGAGQVTYDLDYNKVNEIVCGTGESLHIRNKWVLKDINDYTFYWKSKLPSNPTDQSNDYKYNSITYSILNANNLDVLFQYTLYDFITYDDNGSVVNTCNANCTVFHDGDSYNVFNRKIKLDWEESDPTVYGSSTRLEFRNNYVTLTETGANETEIFEPAIQLDPAEYLIDVSFNNNDVGLLEPSFTSTLNVRAYENNLSNPYSNFYEDMLISPFPLTGKKLLFYRKSEEGILYYYTGDTQASYIINGFEQYKGGVDLQTSGGASIMYVDNYTGMLYLSNNLCRVGFDRLFGTVSFYVYDASTDKYVYVNRVKVEDYDNFEIILLTDDKAQIQFGETIWTMWRGHPYVQCEHINTDLRLVDEYDTANCENLITQDDVVLYDGKRGKEEVYLYNGITTTTLELSGSTDAPSFPSGTTVHAEARVFNEYGESIGFDENDEPVGKVEFLINGESAFVDPAPTLVGEEYVYNYDFVPPVGDDSYVMVARFIPEGHYYESESEKYYYNVARLDTELTVTIDNPYYSESVTGESEDYSIDTEGDLWLDISLKDGLTGENVNGVRVRVYDENNTRILQGMTSNGLRLKIPSSITNKQGIYKFLVLSDSTDTYSSNECYSPWLCLYDYYLDEITTDELNSSLNKNVLTFNSSLPNPVTVIIEGEKYSFKDTFSYTFKEAGKHIYADMYEGDDTYRAMFRDGSYTIVKTNVQLALTKETEYEEIVNLNSQVPVTIHIQSNTPNLPITLYDNGVAVKTVTVDRNEVVYMPMDYIGTHTIVAKYAGDGFIDPTQSNEITVSVEHNETHLRRCNGEVYRYTKDTFQLIDSYNHPLKNKTVYYYINGKKYTTKTGSDGTASLDINLVERTYPVTLEFEGDITYSSCSLDYNLVVKSPITVWKTPSSISGVNGNTSPYQKWVGTSFDGLDGNKYITCGNGLTDATVITGTNGSHNTPDDLQCKNFGFNIPSNAKITDITVRWYERQFNPRNEKTLPNIGYGSAVLENAGKSMGRLIGSEQPLRARVGFNSVSVTWKVSDSWTTTTVTPAKINSSSFTAILKHEKNFNNNAGCLFLKYLTVGVSYVTPSTLNIISEGE